MWKNGSDRPTSIECAGCISYAFVWYGYDFDRATIDQSNQSTSIGVCAFAGNVNCSYASLWNHNPYHCTICNRYISVDYSNSNSPVRHFLLGRYISFDFYSVAASSLHSPVSALRPSVKPLPGTTKATPIASYSSGRSTAPSIHITSIELLPSLTMTPPESPQIKSIGSDSATSQLAVSRCTQPSTSGILIKDSSVVPTKSKSGTMCVWRTGVPRVTTPSSYYDSQIRRF